MIAHVEKFVDFKPDLILWLCKFEHDIVPWLQTDYNVEFVQWTDELNEETTLVDYLTKRLGGNRAARKLVIIDDAQFDLESAPKNSRIATHLANHTNSLVFIVSNTIVANRKILDSSSSSSFCRARKRYTPTPLSGPFYVKRPIF